MPLADGRTWDVVSVDPFMGDAADKAPRLPVVFCGLATSLVTLTVDLDRPMCSLLRAGWPTSSRGTIASAGWCCVVLDQKIQTETLVELLGGCSDETCLKMAWERKAQLDVPKYSRGVSLMAVPESLEEWRSEHRTARKRADRAERLGYRFAEIDRSRYADDILDINLSLPERQGRPMSAGYHDPSVSSLPEYACGFHNIRCYGVFDFDPPYDKKLLAYLTLYRVRDLAMVSMILGHGDHLKNDIMYQLFAGVVEDQAGLGGSFYYNRHDSGTDGLRFYKERVGFYQDDVEWSLS